MISHVDEVHYLQVFENMIKYLDPIEIIFDMHVILDVFRLLAVIKLTFTELSRVFDTLFHENITLNLHASYNLKM